MNGLVESGDIKARTKWKQVYPTFSSDKRYLEMLGNPGSNPIELFWDIVDALDQKLDAKIEIAMGAIKRYNKPPADADVEVTEESAKPEDATAESSTKNFEVGPETTLEEFISIVKSDSEEPVQNLTEEDLKEIYQSVCSQGCLLRSAELIFCPIAARGCT